jgi:hypothetical protein
MPPEDMSTFYSILQHPPNQPSELSNLAPPEKNLALKKPEIFLS